ncbi:MAG TPA: hypothetical protein V6C85_36735, partial [Allocoleopsis sp.]
MGGEVSLDGVILQAPGGRIELGGVTNSGIVGLNVEGNNLRLSFPSNVARADVSLMNGAELNVVAGNGGSIAINAHDLDVLGRSQILAGIGSGQGFVGSQAGNIILNATGTIRMTQASRIENAVNSNAIGNSGNILITTGSLVVTDYDTQLQASTSGQGNAGGVSVTAQDNVFFNGSFAGIFNTVEDGAIGNSGGIDITTGSLSIINGAQLTSNTYGQGNAGKITIVAKDRVVFDGFGGAYSQATSDYVGSGGGINITANSLTVTNGAQLRTDSFFGQGDAGDIVVVASDIVFLDGGEPSSVFSGGFFSSIGQNAEGSGGNIDITTGSLFITNGARLNSSTAGRGNAGNVMIHANDIVSFDNSDVFSTVEEGALGNGGSIDITTGSLFATNGSQLQALTRGQGNAGSITIHANETVSFNGVSS